MNINKIKDLKKLILKIENVFFFTLIVIIFTIDRISKIKIIKDFSERTYYINDYFNFDLILLHSIKLSTESEFGRVDSPPISTISAPSFFSLLICLTAD